MIKYKIIYAKSPHIISNIKSILEKNKINCQIVPNFSNQKDFCSICLKIEQKSFLSNQIIFVEIKEKYNFEFIIEDFNGLKIDLI